MKQSLGSSYVQQVIILVSCLAVHMYHIGGGMEGPPQLLINGDKQTLNSSMIGSWNDLPGCTGSSLGPGIVSVARSSFFPSSQEVRLYDGPGLPVQGLCAQLVGLPRHSLTQQVRLRIVTATPRQSE